MQYRRERLRNVTDDVTLTANLSGNFWHNTLEYPEVMVLNYDARITVG